MVPSFPIGRLNKVEQQQSVDEKTYTKLDGSNQPFTDIITQKTGATFTYTLGKLTKVVYSSGTTKDITYNGDGTFNTVVITYPGKTPITKTATWSSGVLQSILIS